MATFWTAIDRSTADVFFRYSPGLVWEKAQPFVREQRRVAPGYGDYLQRLAESRSLP